MMKGPILHLVLVDSELEMVPERFWSHPAVVSNSRKRKKRSSCVLLDSSLHHSLFRDNDEKKRRGRPDIVHQFLLLGLDSLANLEGKQRLYVHTRNDELIEVDPSTRLPKNYNRYSGLFEELFRSRVVPSPADPLITLQPEMDLLSIISRIRENSSSNGRKSVVIVMDRGHRRIELLDHLKGIHGGKEDIDIICLLGGFAHGGFVSDVMSVSDEALSISDKLLKVWTVQMDLMVCFHHSLDSEETVLL